MRKVPPWGWVLTFEFLDWVLCSSINFFGGQCWKACFNTQTNLSILASFKYFSLQKLSWVNKNLWDVYFAALKPSSHMQFDCSDDKLFLRLNNTWRAWCIRIFCLFQDRYLPWRRLTPTLEVEVAPLLAPPSSGRQFGPRGQPSFRVSPDRVPDTRLLSLTLTPFTACTIQVFLKTSILIFGLRRRRTCPLMLYGWG